MKTGAERAAEMLKLLRTPMTRPAIRRATGWNEKSVTRWCREWVAQGILDESTVPYAGQNGTLAKVYRVADYWRCDA
jgi:hypothetical protein